MRGEFQKLALPEVEKIVLDNDEFGVKHRILRREPEQKFLLYHEGPPPEDLDNWLLDVELAYGRFRADQVSLWLTELGLGLEFADVAAAHADFFAAARRREALGEMAQPTDSPRQIEMKMLAVCAGAEPRLDSIMENLLEELAAGRDERQRLIARSELEAVLWSQAERSYGYHSETPGVRDFAIELFKSAYAMGVGEGTARLNADALVFLKRWRDSVRHHEAFESLSEETADILDIRRDLEGRAYRDLVPLDYFELIDRKILSGLVRDVTNRTISAAETEKLIRQRRNGHWFERYHHLYDAIGHTADFLAALEQIELEMDSLAEILRHLRNHDYSHYYFVGPFDFHLVTTMISTFVSEKAFNSVSADGFLG